MTTNTAQPITHSIDPETGRLFRLADHLVTTMPLHAAHALAAIARNPGLPRTEQAAIAGFIYADFRTSLGAAVIAARRSGDDLFSQFPRVKLDGSLTVGTPEALRKPVWVIHTNGIGQQHAVHTETLAIEPLSDVHLDDPHIKSEDEHVFQHMLRARTGFAQVAAIRYVTSDPASEARALSSLTKLSERFACHASVNPLIRTVRLPAYRQPRQPDIYHPWLTVIDFTKTGSGNALRIRV